MDKEMEELIKLLACYGCEYRDNCEDDFEEGHSQCDYRYRDAEEFADRLFNNK